MQEKKQKLNAYLGIIRLGNSVGHICSSISDVGKVAVQVAESMSDLSDLLNRMQIDSQMYKNLKMKEYTMGLTILEKQRLYGTL
jgi:hypothetical protein